MHLLIIWQTQIIDLAKQTKNFNNIVSIFGIADLSASLIIAELKDITRFNNIKQINASCVLDPTIVQSSKSINYHGTISKREIDMLEKFYLIVVVIFITLSAKLDKENSFYVYIIKIKNRKVNITMLV